MAERDLSNILSTVESEISGTPVPAIPPRPSATVESFAPPRYRNANESFELIQQDFKKAVADMEQRSKALFDELRRITG